LDGGPPDPKDDSAKGKKHNCECPSCVGGRSGLMHALACWDLIHGAWCSSDILITHRSRSHFAIGLAAAAFGLAGAGLGST
jgi:hypothetical protein